MPDNCTPNNNERGFVMKVLTCSVDGCDCESYSDIWPEDDSRAWLCRAHFEQTRRQDWTTFNVGGRVLMLDTAGSWFYLPERDANLHALAKNAGLI